jgi:hypothetical protein
MMPCVCVCVGVCVCICFGCTYAPKLVVNCQCSATRCLIITAVSTYQETGVKNVISFKLE